MNLSKREVIYPRLALICLSLVVVLTLFLFGIGLVALRQKRVESLNLELSTVKLQGERIAGELNRRSWQAAEKALDDPAFEKLLEVERADLPGHDVEAERIAQAIRQDNPIVKQAIALIDGKARTRSGLDRQFRLALERRLEVAAASRTEAYAIRLAGEPCQVFLRQMDRGRAAAFVVDNSWLADVLLPHIAATSGLDTTSARHFRLRGGQPSRIEEGARLPIQMGGLFPFMRLEIEESPLQRQQAKAVRETVYLVVSCLMFLSIIGVGFFLIARSMRELQVRQLRTDMMSAFSHDLRTPLTLIRLYAEILQNDSAVSPNDRSSYCQIISRESERLSKIIDRVLTARKIEQGEEQFHLVPGDLASTIAETVGSYAEHLRLRGFKLDLDLASSLPEVHFDSGAVSQAILNLMDNARKYSGEARYIAVRAFRDGSESVVIEVEDHGCGIPAEEQPRIFNSFYRASKEGSQQGFGLGLFLVRHIMEAHGGRIDVISEPGVGSRFQLVFPLSRSVRLLGLARRFRPFARYMQLARRGLGGR